MTKTSNTLHERHSATHNAVAGCLTLCLMLCIVLSGCQSGHMRASRMPPELLAKPAQKTQKVQLSNVTAGNAQNSQIAAGDLLEVWIATGDEKAPTRPWMARVSEDGTVMSPIVGKVTVAGMEPAAAGETIAQASIDRQIYRQPHVTVAVKSRATHRVTVIGSVKKPGAYELPRSSCDIVAAIASAGGMTDDAGIEVEVLRQSSSSYFADAPPTAQPTVGEDGEITQVSFNAPPVPQIRPNGAIAERINLAQLSSRPGQSRPLGDGDVVMVLPEEKRVIHVSGLVRKPNQFEIPPDQDVRVLDALAMAGGASSTVADKVLVIRQVPNQPEPAVIQVSIGEAKKNGRENLVLSPGDLVSVENTISTATVDTLQKFMRVSLGISSRLITF